MIDTAAQSLHPHLLATGDEARQEEIILLLPSAALRCVRQCCTRYTVLTTRNLTHRRSEEAEYVCHITNCWITTPSSNASTRNLRHTALSIIQVSLHWTIWAPRVMAGASPSKCVGLPKDEWTQTQTQVRPKYEFAYLLALGRGQLDHDVCCIVLVW